MYLYSAVYLSKHSRAVIKLIISREHGGHFSPQKQCQLSGAGLWVWVYGNVCLRDISGCQVHVLHVALLFKPESSHSSPADVLTRWVKCNIAYSRYYCVELHCGYLYTTLLVVNGCLYGYICLCFTWREGGKIKLHTGVLTGNVSLWLIVKWHIYENTSLGWLMKDWV